MKNNHNIMTWLTTITSALFDSFKNQTGTLQNHNPEQTEKTVRAEEPVEETIVSRKIINLYDLCPSLLETDADEVFDSLEEGDIVFAAMPFSVQTLENIDPAHRVRPYAVVRILDDGFIGYPLYSGVMGENARHSMKITPEDYEVKKECHIVLERVSRIPVEHISNYVDHLSVSDQLRLNMIMNAAEMNEKKYPRFHVNTHRTVNSIVNKGMNYYYIYAMDGNNASLVPFTKEKTETPVNYCNMLCYIDRDQKMNVVLDESYQNAGTLTRSVHNSLARYYTNRRKEEKRRAAKQRRTMEVPAYAA